MTIPITSKQSIGGAISKRGRRDYIPARPPRRRLSRAIDMEVTACVVARV